MLIIIAIISSQGVVTINFQILTKDNKATLDAFFQAGYYENSHLNFTNLFMWRNSYNIMWAIENDVLYFKAIWDNVQFALQPIGPIDKMPKAIERWVSYFKETKQPFYMSGVEKFMIDEFAKLTDFSFDIAEDRDNFDYVYLAQDLISLAGRKFHAKKNHLNSFRKNYPEAQYMMITDDIITECKLNINAWYKKHVTPDDPFVTAERNAIIEVLNNFAELKLVGAAIMLDKRVVAFTFGEQLNADTAVIHVEKADPDVRGAYSAINQLFVENSWSNMTYINREEDMGIEGLRKAKLSYRPVKMIEKYNIKLQ